jgi:glycerol-3-phosphate acyltransferase PlsX
LFDELEYAGGKKYEFEAGGRNFKTANFFEAVTRVTYHDKGAVVTKNFLEPGLRYSASNHGPLDDAVHADDRDFGSPDTLLAIGADAQHLVNLAVMGSAMARVLLAVERPKVGLLNIGVEEVKGLEEVREAGRILREARPPFLDYTGFVEGDAIGQGVVDVVVTDGFTGNVALKALEGTIRTVIQGLRDEITATTLGKVGGLLIRPASRRLRRRLDPDTYGGAYLLGLRGLAVIAHGNSSRTAIGNAVRLAARGVEHDVTGRLAARLPERAETPA